MSTIIAGDNACSVLRCVCFGPPADWIQAWQRFRKAYPCHIQTIALSRPNAAGNRLLIVSEPPPDVSMDRLVAAAPQALASGSIERTRVGFDGWVADALFDLPPLDDRALASLIESVHIRLFGTAYKAVAAEIPSLAPSKPAYNIDLHVPSGILAKWLLPPHASKRATPWAKVLFAVFFAALILMA